MTPQIATTIEQSKRLLSCGVDPKTADMRIQEDMTGFRISVGEWYPGYANLNMTPAWSLGALIGLFDPELCLSLTKHGNDYYTVDSPLVFEIECIGGNTPTEACVRMIEWLTEQNYSLNKIEE